MVKRTWYSKFFEKTSINYIKSIIKDPNLVKKLTTNYPFGCKRVLVVENYYETLAKENCEVIDSPITLIDKDMITDSKGVERKFDMIIYGTGFRTSEFLSPLEIVGLKEKT